MTAVIKAAKTIQNKLRSVSQTLGDESEFITDARITQAQLNNLAAAAGAQKSLLQDKLETGGENAEQIRLTRNQILAVNTQNYLPSFREVKQLTCTKRQAIIDVADDKAGVSEVIDTINKAEKVDALEKKLSVAEKKLNRVMGSNKKRYVDTYHKPQGEPSVYLHCVDANHCLKNGLTIDLLKAQGILLPKSTHNNIIPNSDYAHFFVKVVRITTDTKLNKEISRLEIPALSEAGAMYVSQMYEDLGIPDNKKEWLALAVAGNAETYWNSDSE